MPLSDQELVNYIDQLHAIVDEADSDSIEQELILACAYFEFVTAAHILKGVRDKERIKQVMLDAFESFWEENKDIILNATTNTEPPTSKEQH